MTEQEYIDATNLTKLRAVLVILRDVMFTDDNHRAALTNVRSVLDDMETELSNNIEVG